MERCSGLWGSEVHRGVILVLAQELVCAVAAVLDAVAA
jgi:hypothetical protein